VWKTTQNLNIHSEDVNVFAQRLAQELAEKPAGKP
jgi:hypothetical protein